MHRCWEKLPVDMLGFALARAQLWAGVWALALALCRAVCAEWARACVRFSLAGIDRSVCS